MTGAYDDILFLEHFEPKRHPRQPMAKRAAQFSPFAALTGSGDAVEETARYTDTRQEIPEESRERINLTLQRLQACLSLHPAVFVEYFVPDAKKAGGFYRTVTGTVHKIRSFEQELVLSGGVTILFSDIYHIAELPFSSEEQQNT